MKAEGHGGASKVRVVIDTHIWISAALSRSGAPARLVHRVLAGTLPVFSPETFTELETRLWRPKFDPYISIEMRRLLLHDLNATAFWVDVPAGIAAGAYSRDVDEDKFIHAALAANAPWLITGDQDLLTVAPLSCLRILTPADALSLPEFGECP